MHLSTTYAGLCALPGIKMHCIGEKRDITYFGQQNKEEGGILVAPGASSTWAHPVLASSQTHVNIWIPGD